MHIRSLFNFLIKRSYLNDNYYKQNKLENETKELREMLRLHAMDDLDIYEIMRHRARLQAWNEFVDELYRIVLYL